MFDIVGFWFAVTVITGAMLIAPIFWIIRGVGGWALGAIPDKDDADRAKDWLYRFFYNEPSLRSAPHTKALPEGRHHCFFGFRVNFTDDWWSWLTALAPISWILSILWGGEWTTDSQDRPALVEYDGIVAGISELAQFLSIPLGLVAPVVLLALLLRMVVKYAYCAVKFKEKVESHVSDKSIHS